MYSLRKCVLGTEKIIWRFQPTGKHRACLCCRVEECVICTVKGRAQAKQITAGRTRTPSAVFCFAITALHQVGSIVFHILHVFSCQSLIVIVITPTLTLLCHHRHSANVTKVNFKYNTACMYRKHLKKLNRYVVFGNYFVGLILNQITI